MAVRHVCLICHNEIPHAGAACPHCKARLSSTVGATPQLLVAIFAVMIVFFVGTGFLTGAFRAERGERFSVHLQTARTLADYGYYEEAVEEYRESLTYKPDDIGARLGLARSLYYLDRLSESESHLINLIEMAPTLADANRLLARIAERGERVQDAIRYYRTAIHGEWRISPERNRIRTRFELIDLLEEQGQDMQASGELVDLRRDAPDDPLIKNRIGAHFLRVGAPSRAIQVFEELIESNPSDGQAHAGIGEAEFALAHYYSARTSYQRALRLLPDHPDVQQRLALLERIRALDPTYRPYGNVLSSSGRYRRSRELLDRVVKVFEYCTNPATGPDFVGPPAPIPGELQPWFDQSKERLETRRSATDDRIAALISLAEDLWLRRASICENPDSHDEPVTHVLRKLAS